MGAGQPQVTSQQSVDTFKRVYGEVNDLRPGIKDPWDEILAFEESKKVGDSYVEDFILGDSTGYTYGGSGQDAFAINPASAASVKQGRIIPSQTVHSDILSWAFIGRSSNGDDASFFNGTKTIMKIHLESHNHFVRAAKIYGQSYNLLGYVSYDPAGTIYRNSTFTGSGNITLTKKDGSSIAFTAGINVAQKAILVGKGYFASAYWVGKKGMTIYQVDSTGAVVNSGKLISCDARNGILYVDFVPTAAGALTGAGSIRLCYKGWEGASPKCMVGVHRILTNTGTLFDIDAAEYDLYSGNVLDLQSKAFNLNAVHDGVSDAVGAGGLQDPLDILVNPKVFGRMATDEAAFRKYDASYKSSAENGFEAIEYYAANGKNRVLSSPYVMEGHAFGVVRDMWRCSGGQVPGFRVMGMQDQIIFPLQDQSGFVVRSYGDEYVICHMPAKQILWTGLDYEGVAYSMG